MGREIGDVEGLESCLSAMAGDRRTSRLGLLVPLEIGQRQIIAGGGEGFGDGAADTALGPGDEGDGRLMRGDPGGGYARRCAALARRW